MVGKASEKVTMGIGGEAKKENEKEGERERERRKDQGGCV